MRARQPAWSLYDPLEKREETALQRCPVRVRGVVPWCLDGDGEAEGRDHTKNEKKDLSFKFIDRRSIRKGRSCGDARPRRDLATRLYTQNTAGEALYLAYKQTCGRGGLRLRSGVSSALVGTVRSLTRCSEHMGS